MDVVFDPRFDYGRAETRFEVDGAGALARSSEGDTLVAVMESATWTERPEGGLKARVKLRAGERKWMVLSWGAPGPEPVQGYRPYEHLRSTRAKWREWASKITYEGPWRPD